MCSAHPFGVDSFAILARICFFVKADLTVIQSHSILRNYWVSRLFFKDPVRLGMHVAFGRVRRKTEPTGPRGENSIEKWTIECLWCPLKSD